MASGLVIHVAAGDERRTEVMSADLIRIGPGEDCDVRLQSTSFPFDYGAAFELSRTNGNYHVREIASSVKMTLNGVPVKDGATIDDGDELRVLDSDITLQFFPVGNLPALVTGRRRRRETEVAPFIEQAALESSATARRDDAKVFLREFTRELIREINPSTKIAALLIAAAFVFGVLYIGFKTYEELQRSRRVIDEQNQQLVRLREQVTGTNDQIRGLDQSTTELRNSLSLAVKVRSDFGNGVCLISGTYAFFEPGTNRPLRYREASTAAPASEESAASPTPSEGESGQQSSLTPNGNGAIARFDFVGTGFHVGGGYIVTNRHIMQPWTANESTAALTNGTNWQPRLTRIVAFFPGRAQPIALRVRQVSSRSELDLAVCTLETPEVPADIPTLPFDLGSDTVRVGNAIVLLGYPSGPDRLLAYLSDSESRMAQARASSYEALFSYLAERDLIKPLTTQGHITDLIARRIIYDARTAEGGSGSPLFGPSGRVIGVNYGIFPENNATNFGVPISHALPLLRRAGWQPPEPLNDNEEGANNANVNQQNSRPTGGATTINPSR